MTVHRVRSTLARPRHSRWPRWVRSHSSGLSGARTASSARCRPPVRRCRRRPARHRLRPYRRALHSRQSRRLRHPGRIGRSAGVHHARSGTRRAQRGGAREGSSRRSGSGGGERGRGREQIRQVALSPRGRHREGRQARPHDHDGRPAGSALEAASDRRVLRRARSMDAGAGRPCVQGQPGDCRWNVAQTDYPERKEPAARVARGRKRRNPSRHRRWCSGRSSATSSGGLSTPPTLSSTGTYNAIAENTAVNGGRTAYVNALLPSIRKHKDAVGFAVAINGKMTAADAIPRQRCSKRCHGSCSNRTRLRRC